LVAPNWSKFMDVYKELVVMNEVLKDILD